MTAKKSKDELVRTDIKELQVSCKSRQEFWLELFYYENGILYWIVQPSNRTKVGDVAGFSKGDGYFQVRVAGVWHYVHRIIYEMHHGDTDLLVDHKDRNPSNNLLDNLRPATTTQNRANTGLSNRNTSGHRGVNFRPEQNRWRAQIRINGNMMSLGQYTTYEEACLAYDKAAVGYHKEFASVL